MTTNTLRFYTVMQNMLHPEEARVELRRVQREFIESSSLVKIVLGFCNDGEGFRPSLLSFKQFLEQHYLPFCFAEVLFQKCSGGRTAPSESYLFSNEQRRSN